MEEIIIDGVDVAGCEFYQIEANELYPKAQYCGSMRNTFCENEPDCYYKQLKRLEQENAELKEKIKKYAAINEQETKDYAELKAENERLKAEVESLQYNMAVYSMKDIDNAATLFAKDKAILEQKCALLEAYKNKYYQQTLDDEIKINELYQTLQDIKTIAENVCRDDCPDLKFGYCIGLGECSFRARKQILDLITKAEEE